MRSLILLILSVVCKYLHLQCKRPQHFMLQSFVPPVKDPKDYPALCLVPTKVFGP